MTWMFIRFQNLKVIYFISRKIFFLALTLPLCNLVAGQKKYIFQESRMGSPFTITICADDSLRAAGAAMAAFKMADTLNNLLSDYIDSSEINRLSATSGQGHYVKVSAYLFNILAVGQQAAELSGGAYDVTVGPLVKLWRKARITQTFPDRDSISAALDHVGYHYLHLDSTTQSVWLEKIGMRLDVGGLGKGYVAQIALQSIHDDGFSSAMVNAGGKIVVGDPPPGTKGWIIGINVPGEKQAIMQQLLLLSNMAVATSGDIYQHIDFDGVRYSHIVNPITGIGLTHSSNVTIIAARGIDADWLATACSILSVKRSMALLKKFNNSAAFITQIKNGAVIQYRSDRLAKFLLK